MCAGPRHLGARMLSLIEIFTLNKRMIWARMGMYDLKKRDISTDCKR